MDNHGKRKRPEHKPTSKIAESEHDYADEFQSCCFADWGCYSYSFSRGVQESVSRIGRSKLGDVV